MMCLRGFPVNYELLYDQPPSKATEGRRAKRRNYPHGGWSSRPHLTTLWVSKGQVGSIGHYSDVARTTVRPFWDSLIGPIIRNYYKEILEHFVGFEGDYAKMLEGITDTVVHGDA